MKKIPLATAIAGGEAASLTPMPLNGDHEFSLYFHIPFCTRKCDYCHFYVLPNQSRYHDLYLEALKLEWIEKKDLLPKNKPISIYFGGGTPSLLPYQAMAEILSWIAPDPSCEVTLEANPDDVTPTKMKQFVSIGINRVSLGVQSFDNRLLSTLTRTHSANRSLEAIAEILHAGISNLSIDLMYDLPGQTESSWHRTLEQAVALPITHLSLYNLTIEPHTVFYKYRKQLILPHDELSLSMLSSALAILEKGEFTRYEISAFCRQGKISLHNTGYWSGRPFLGLGPSAFSFWNGARFRNMANLNRYAKALHSGHNPTDFYELLPPLEQLKEGIAIGLRRLAGISISTWPPHFIQRLSLLKESGLLEERENSIRLTTKGLLFHDTVASEIMSW